MSSIKFHEEDDTFSLNLTTATLDDLRQAVWVMKHEVFLKQVPGRRWENFDDVIALATLSKIVEVIDESIGEDPWEANKRPPDLTVRNDTLEGGES